MVVSSMDLASLVANSAHPPLSYCCLDLPISTTCFFFIIDLIRTITLVLGFLPILVPVALLN